MARLPAKLCFWLHSVRNYVELQLNWWAAICFISCVKFFSLLNSCAVGFGARSHNSSVHESAALLQESH